MGSMAVNGGAGGLRKQEMEVQKAKTWNSPRKVEMHGAGKCTALGVRAT